MNVVSNESSNTDDSLNSEPPNGGLNLEKPTKLKNFIEKHYNCNVDDWNDWKWQIRNSITNSKDLMNILNLTEEEKKSFDGNDKLPFKITPYYLFLVSQSKEIRKSVIPTVYENIVSEGENIDPLDEEQYRHGNVIHKYSDRALFISTNTCGTICRYCTRSRIIHKEKINWEEGLNYIKEHNEIKDVIISGGDGLMVQLDKLDYLLNELKKIEHVQIIRIGTKIPIVLPYKIDDNLINILKKYQPLYINIHVINSFELTKDFKIACDKLINAGVVLGSQTVLLKDINDNVDTMEKLMMGLIKMRVRPYYLYSCDLINGSSHFRCNIEKGVQIIKELRNRISGLAIPNFIIDTKIRKIPIINNYTDEINEYLGNI